MQDRPLQDGHETIRIPVYGEEKFIPDSLTGFDLEQQFINCYPQVSQDPITGEKVTSMAKRPGNSAIINIQTAVGAASASDVHVKAHIVVTQLIDVFIVAAFDSTRNKTYIVQYRPITNTATLLGDIGTTAWIDPVHITEYQQVNSGTIYPAIAICWKKADESVSRCYTARSDGTVFNVTTVTQITDTGFPDQQTPAKICTGPFQQMNGLIYIMCTDGSIYNSGGANGTPNDASSASMWNTLSVIQTYQAPDKGVGIFRYKHHLLAVGKDSIEFFNDIGNPPPASSLERTEQAFIKFGSPTSKSVINVADTLFWIAYGSNNTLGLWKMEGYTPVKVSRSKQDFQITNGYHASTNINTIDLISMSINGKVNIGINSVPAHNMLWRETSGWGQTADDFKSLETAYCGIGYTQFYNASDDLWWTWSCMPDVTARIVPAVAYPSTSASATVTYHYTQYFFYDPNPVTNWSAGTPAQTPAALSSYALKLNEADLYNYTGMFDIGSSLSEYPICASIQFNTFQFNTQKRKRINRLDLIFSNTPYTASTSISPFGTISHGADTGDYSIGLIFRRGNYTADSTVNKRRYIYYPNTARRYYFNNLGTGRVWSFCVVCLSKDSFNLQAIELDVEQGTH